jgi:hypothetical protein
MKTMISYHPISEIEIHNWYYNIDFSLILDDVNYSLIKTARASNMSDEYLKKYIKTMKKAVKTDADAVFDTTHGFYIAKIQTYFRCSFAVKGSFSQLIAQKEYFKTYTKSWEVILENIENFTFLNKLTDMPSSGIYIPAEKIIELLKDYNGNLIIKRDINDFFGESATNAFIESLNYAQENNLGLLEANAILKFELPIIDNGSTNETEIKGIDIIQEAKNEFLSDKETREKKSIFSRVFRKK